MISGGEGIGIGTKGVRAELYKLKVGAFVQLSQTLTSADRFTDLLWSLWQI